MRVCSVCVCACARQLERTKAGHVVCHACFNQGLGLLCHFTVHTVAWPSLLLPPSALPALLPQQSDILAGVCYMRLYAYLYVPTDCILTDTTLHPGLAQLKAYLVG